MITFKFPRATTLLTLIILSSSGLFAQILDDNVIASTNFIEYEDFLSHLKYLSDDELEGRGTGSVGFLKASNYIADQFGNLGLLPFGDSTTFFQKVLLLNPSMKGGTFKLRIEKNSKWIDADYGSNISVVLNSRNPIISEKQQVMFVGYGNIIPEEHINDYDGHDVKGKTVIVALGGPKGIKNPAFHDRQAKVNNAISQGASGIILFYPKATIFQNRIFTGVHEFLSEKMIFLADRSIKSSVFDSDIKFAAFAKKKLIKEIFTLNGLKLNKEIRSITNVGDSRKEFLGTLNCNYRIGMDSIKCQNVVALLPGSDVKLKNEYIVVGAHLDGSGIGKSVKGDSIYNGMVDNASGAAAILSVAKVLGELSENPKRSVIFICYTAEENGLIGSWYFSNRNNVNNGKIVANLNIDMLSKTYETEDMAPLGYSHSNLSEAADYAARILKLKIDNNKQAELDYIERSDQISFIKRGIPALFIAGGSNAVDPLIDGERKFEKWMKKKYHSPFDDLNQEYSDKAFLEAIKFNVLTTYFASNFLEEIKWNRNSWLYKKYVLEKQ